MRQRPIAATAALVAALTVAATAAPVTDPPDGLSASDWSSIRAAYEAGRHAVFEVAGVHRAHNPGQQWTTVFDGCGFTTTPDAGGWSWGLELVAYGWGEPHYMSDGPSATSTDGGRLARDWDGRLTEWYVNDTRGLEHGFTLAERPAGESTPLTLEFAIRGGLRPAVSADGRDVRFQEPRGETALTYEGLVVLDTNGNALAAVWHFVGEDRLHLRVEDAGACYPLTIDPIAQQAYLKASNTDAGDNFGFPVAVSGDTVVVGASFEDSNATGVNGNQGSNAASNSGAAYVFVRSGTTWSQQAYLKASNTNAGDRFGSSVAVSGDTVVVGAHLEDSNATGVNGNQADNSAANAGAAYVFVRSGTSWSQQAYLKPSNTDASDLFGLPVAISDDTVIVGATEEDSSATGVNGNQADNSAADSGAAYVFVRSGTSWGQQAYLKASNTGAGDLFGNSVSASGDTVVVGAWGESSSATGVNGNQGNNSADAAGAAYVFARSGTSWGQQAYLKASNTGATDHFGISVAISGDMIVVGGADEDSNATGVNGNQADNSAANAGAAYVFVRSGTSWSQQAYLKASNTNAGDVFANNVAVSGDTVVVGAFLEDSNGVAVNGDQADNSAVNAGAVYVFDPCLGSSMPYGTGCAGTSGWVPALVLSGCPKPNGSITLSLTQGLGGSLALFLFGGGQGSVTIGGGCAMLLNPLLPLQFILPLGGAGAGNGSIAIPAALPASTAGVGFTMQAAVQDGASPVGFSMTNGVAVQVAP